MFKEILQVISKQLKIAHINMLCTILASYGFLHTFVKIYIF